RAVVALLVARESGVPGAPVIRPHVVDGDRVTHGRHAPAQRIAVARLCVVLEGGAHPVVVTRGHPTAPLDVAVVAPGVGAGLSEGVVPATSKEREERRLRRVFFARPSLARGASRAVRLLPRRALPAVVSPEQRLGDR